MLPIYERQYQDGRISRRVLLQAGGLALGGLTLSDLLRERSHAALTSQPKRDPAQRETAVIQVFMGGGPSHIDLYDLKPNAPAEIRGEFRPISTRLPGVQLGELMPQLAGVMDRVALVRSVAHGNASHLPASHWMMTGYEPPPATTGNINPACGANVARARGPNAPGMPAYVSIPRRQLLGGPAYHGVAYNPFTTDSDPVEKNFAVRNLQLPAGLDGSRLHDRQTLLASFDRMRADLDNRGDLAGTDRFARQAMEIITSPKAQAAFDIAREDDATRELYGRTSAGQRCLLARRLVEAGVTFVTVLSGGEWDTHTSNFEILRRDVPPIDRAISGLVTDLYQRGLDRQVLVLVYGEFGRTPKINPQAGRDHWPGAFSVLFSGGGMRVGQVIGATDSHAAFPTSDPFTPGDVLSTMYNFLGINPAREFRDRAGRPLRILPEGKPIAALA